MLTKLLLKLHGKANQIQVLIPVKAVRRIQATMLPLVNPIRFYPWIIGGYHASPLPLRLNKSELISMDTIHYLPIT